MTRAKWGQVRDGKTSMQAHLGYTPDFGIAARVKDNELNRRKRRSGCTYFRASPCSAATRSASDGISSSLCRAARWTCVPGMA
jgi:hypothetical protein